VKIDMGHEQEFRGSKTMRNLRAPSNKLACFTVKYLRSFQLSMMPRAK
jgi:hypothetical protein